MARPQDSQRSDTPLRKPDPLAMRIYAALLGASPKVPRNPAKGTPRLKMHIRVETRFSSEVDSPFRAPTLRESLERVAAVAVSAISDASERLRGSRSSVNRPSAPRTTPTTSEKPIVLIGRSGRSRSARAVSRSEAA